MHFEVVETSDSEEREISHQERPGDASQVVNKPIPSQNGSDISSFASYSGNEFRSTEQTGSEAELEQPRKRNKLEDAPAPTSYMTDHSSINFNGLNSSFSGGMSPLTTYDSSRHQPINDSFPPASDLQPLSIPTSPLTSSSLSSISPPQSPSGTEPQAKSDSVPFGPDFSSNYHMERSSKSTRYSLRPRVAKQLNPYEYDKRLYKMQMQANPEAIVKITSPKSTGARKEPTLLAETHQSWLVDDEQERGLITEDEIQHAGQERNDENDDAIRGRYPAFLRQDLSSSDEDTAETRRLLREARRLQLRKKKEQEIGHRRPKKYPLAKLMEEPTAPRTYSPTQPSFSSQTRGFTPHYDTDTNMTRETPPDVGITHDTATPPKADTEMQSQSSESSDLIILAQPKALRQLSAWRRMQPAIMIKKELQASLMGTSGRAGSRSTRENYREADDDVPLVPGQARVRTGVRRSNAEIKGDTESSDSTDDGELSQTGQLIARSSGGESSKVVGKRDTADIVDWMLARTRSVVTQRRRRPRTSQNDMLTTSGRRSTHDQAQRPQLRLVSRDARKFGTERQTLLSFAKSSASHRKLQPRNPDGNAAVPPDAQPSDYDQTEVHTGNEMDGYSDPHGRNTTLSKAPRKRKRKHNHLQTRIYTFASSGTRVTSGNKFTRNLTIDLEDDVLNDALAPLQGTAARVKSSIEASQSAAHNAHQNSRVVMNVDFGLNLMPSGISLQGGFYIGQGWLYELVQLMQLRVEMPVPPSHDAFGFTLGPETKPESLPNILTSLCDRLSQDFSHSHTVDNADLRQWQGLLRATCHLISWLVPQCGEQDQRTLQTAVYESVSQLLKSVALPTPTDALKLSAFWFCIDISIRVNNVQRDHGEQTPALASHVQDLIRALVRQLYLHGFKNIIASIEDKHDGLDPLTTPRLATELWICLIHILNVSRPTLPAENLQDRLHPFWDLIYDTIQCQDDNLTALEASENVWRTIFSLAALSQISVHGMTTSTCHLPSCWPLVAFALDRIRLSADIQNDRSLPEHKLIERDYIIRIIAHRCFVLWERWQWGLDNATHMFNRLARIFRSRKFANLIGEGTSDFPEFMLKHDVRLLSSLKRKDTAFVVFLKLIVQSGRPRDELAINHGTSQQLKKLLALAIPVGSVPFTRVNPPTNHELSMLHNRLSAIAISIHLDPSRSTVQKRVNEARRYVNFSDADWQTRMTCIRCTKYLAWLLRYHKLPLEHVLNWLADMADILMNEYGASNIAKDLSSGARRHTRTNPTIMAIGLILGSVRQIITTQVNPLENKHEYPDPALLEGSWLTRLLNNKSLSNTEEVKLQVLKLVQAFLEARGAAMPAPLDPYRATLEPDDDSQYDLLDLEIDFNDPGLRAVLGEDVNATTYQQEYEARVCEVMNTHISRAIYRLMLNQFMDLSELNFVSVDDVDEWVECWVRCADLLVHNGKKDWSAFIGSRGMSSWQNIDNRFWRRRVGLRFMITLLRVAPTAYKAEEWVFLELLMESLVVPDVTLEHEYTSQLFAVDRCQHVLMREIAQQLPNGVVSGPVMTIQEFLGARFGILDVIVSNLASQIRKAKDDADIALSNICKLYTQFIVSMFTWMKLTHESMQAGSGDRRRYSGVCRRVAEIVNQHVELKSDPHLIGLLRWGAAVE